MTYTLEISVTNFDGLILLCLELFLPVLELYRCRVAGWPSVPQNSTSDRRYLNRSYELSSTLGYT
jgi:hypothetical protein